MRKPGTLGSKKFGSKIFLSIFSMNQTILRNFQHPPGRVSALILWFLVYPQPSTEESWWILNVVKSLSGVSRLVMQVHGLWAAKLKPHWQTQLLSNFRRALCNLMGAMYRICREERHIVCNVNCWVGMSRVCESSPISRRWVTDQGFEVWGSNWANSDYLCHF